MTVLWIALGVFAVIGVVRGVKRGTSQTAAKHAGERWCENCGARLAPTRDKMAYMPTCRKCGQAQSWA